MSGDAEPGQHQREDARAAADSRMGARIRVRWAPFLRASTLRFWRMPTSSSHEFGNHGPPASSVFSFGLQQSGGSARPVPHCACGCRTANCVASTGVGAAAV